MIRDALMFANKIEIPLEMIKELEWENNDTRLRLWVEDDMLIIGKEKSVFEVCKSIETLIGCTCPKCQNSSSIQQDIMIKRIELLEKRMIRLEDKH